jgi:CHAD domain-containing protein
MRSSAARKAADAIATAALDNGAQAAAAPAPADSRAERHERLVKLMRRQLQRFVNNVARVLTGEDQRAIHDLRVGSRRLQQLLVAMYGDALPRRARAMRRVLRRTRRAVGQWRNYDVVVEAIERRARRARDEERRRAWAIVLKSAAEARRREIRRARKRLMRLGIFGLRESGEALAAGAAGSEALDAPFWAAVAQAYDRWREAYALAARSRRPEEIHAFRIRSKRLRYRIELARELGAEDTGPILAWFKTLQDGLGRWRDRVELGRVIARAIADPELLLAQSRCSMQLLKELERLNRRADREVEELLRGLERSAGFARCEQWVKAHVQAPAEPPAPAESPAAAPPAATPAVQS